MYSTFSTYGEKRSTYCVAEYLQLLTINCKQFENDCWGCMLKVYRTVSIFLFEAQKLILNSPFTHSKKYKRNISKLTEIYIKLSGSNLSQHLPVLFYIQLVTNYPRIFESKSNLFGNTFKQD